MPNTSQNSDRTLPWHMVVEAVAPHIVRVSTPRGSGTGFLLGRSPSGKFTGIATAAHVIADSHYWREPIRIEHYSSKEVLYLEHKDRGIIVEANTDSAAIVFDTPKLALPEQPLNLIAQGRVMKVGAEVGWMGFPANAQGNLCFFGGRISCSMEEWNAYLLDGVVINGVSGGPVIFPGGGDGVFKIVGAVSAYRPNWATGSALPGLGVATSLASFYSAITQISNLKDAESEPIAPSPLAPQPEPPQTPANTRI